MSKTIFASQYCITCRPGCHQARLPRKTSRRYRLASGGQFASQTYSGDVRVTGYNGDSIIVTGTKKGRDRDKVEVEDKVPTVVWTWEFNIQALRLRRHSSLTFSPSR